MLDPAAVLSISELNRLARQCLEREFPLLWVAGEVSNLTRAASGHVYFSLKDATAQARCVMFRARAQTLPWRLENGQEVEARALVSIYEARGDYQLNIETLRRAGLGRLFEAFSRLKARLEGEGLFAPERKRPLPRFPQRIGIVTSPRAAALRDVLVTLERRAPHLSAIIYPTLVQGDAAAAEIAAAIETANLRRECDLLLVVRGGGSIEDLWAFNEESLARAIGASTLPVVCGIGHETDTTIADFVADLRAPTPTAAAELVTREWHDASARIEASGTALHRSIGYQIANRQQALDRLSLRLLHPAARMAQAGSRLALLGSRLGASMVRLIRGHRQSLNRAALGLVRATPRTASDRGRIQLLAQRLDAAVRNQQETRTNALSRLAGALAHLNPEATLARGFAIVRDETGCLVTDAAALHAGQAINLRLARGEATANIVDTKAMKQTIAT